MQTQDTSAPIAEPSIAELRAMTSGETAAAAETTPAPAEAAETAEGGEEQSESASAADTGDKTKQEPTEGGQERDEHGKFKGQKNLDKRFRELTSKIRDLEGKLAEKESGAASPKGEQKQEAAQVEKPVRPKFEDFETVAKYEAAEEEYLEKLADWRIEQREAAKTQQAEEAKRAAQQNEVASAWGKRVEAAQAEIKDFQEVCEAADDVELHPIVQQAILDSDQGPKLVYHLAKNPEEAQRIAGLSPVKAALEIGKLDAKLSAATPATPQPKKTTGAPPPPAKAEGDPAPKVLDASDYGNLSIGELKKVVDKSRRER